MNKKTIIIIFIVIAILILSGGIYYVFFGLGKPGGGVGGGYGVDFNIGIDVSGIGRGTENVLKNMPLTNPLEKVANPFRDAYKNPFQ